MKAFITGITGQDGSYLAELLLSKGYEVHGILRRSSSINTKRIDHIFNDLNLHYGDVTDASCVSNIISSVKPDEIYSLAAQSHVQISFEMPNYTGQVDGLGTLNILEAVKNHSPNSRVYFAGTSELYGGMEYNRPESGYDESSAFHPRSPYGVAKLYGFWISKNYRESYNMFICNGILFNHGSPRRGVNFIEKKIVSGLVGVKKNKQNCLNVGNLYSKRDLGYAKEYVEGMYLMLQQEKPDDYVLATGESYSVKEMIEITCSLLDMKINWKGEGLNEIGFDEKSNKEIIKIDKKYFRPAEVDFLIGNSSKAQKVLGWFPKTKTPELLKIMVSSELTEN